MKSLFYSSQVITPTSTWYSTPNNTRIPSFFFEQQSGVELFAEIWWNQNMSGIWTPILPDTRKPDYGRWSVFKWEISRDFSDSPDSNFRFRLSQWLLMCVLQLYIFNWIRPTEIGRRNTEHQLNKIYVWLSKHLEEKFQAPPSSWSLPSFGNHYIRFGIFVN